MRYYHNHLIIGTVINILAVVVGYCFLGLTPILIALAATGGVFYAVREVIQWWFKHWWDHKGFIWPVVGSVPTMTLTTYLLSIL